MSLEGAIAANGNTRGWSIIALRSLISQSKADNRPNLPLLGVNLHSGVTQRSTNDGRPAASEDLTAYKVVAPGNIIMNRLGKPHGSVGMSPWDGITSPAYWVMEINPQLGEPRFFHHLLRSRHLVAEYERLGKNQPPNQFDISWDAFRAIEIPLPPLEEQRRIAHFLDAETARIDRLRELRKQQSELLDEASFRQIYDAVRGAHVEGNRKDSGLKWLGAIPADWRVGGVSHYFEVELGKMLNQERTQGEHMRPYLRVANVQWDRIDVSDLAMMDFPPEEQARYRLKPGDLLVNEGGSWPGRAAIWDGVVPEIYYQKALHRIRARGAELPRWLYYCLVVAERLRVFQIQGNTSTITHLTREQLRPQRFPFPEPDVQGDLVAQLDRAASRDLEIRQLLDGQLALLTERRQALITAAVTGQFDVSTASGRNVTDGVTA
ncbi:restriction endonuclease subunit S [Streptomyces sp. NPDC091682]|uniref:restriction endonuclease subunit S n=1 Tax=Streptomyces sp. NPDC091682 TaxID=3366005 RepID=UPI00380CD5A9